MLYILCNLQENLDGHGVLKSTFKYSGYLFLNYIEKAQVEMLIWTKEALKANRFAVFKFHRVPFIYIHW